MPVMEVTLRGNFAGQETINRWNYVGSGTPAAVQRSFALISAFGAIFSGAEFVSGSILRRLQGLVSEDFSFRAVEARDVYSTTDFYERPFPSGVSGTQAGESLSPAIAYGLRSSRVLTTVRRGTKRFAGVPESQSGARGMLTSGALLALDEMAALMSATLTYDDEGNTLTFVPAVCGKFMYTTPPDPPAYRYYPSEAEQLVKTAQGVLWESYPQVRTQVSRQYGRGS